MCPDGNFCNGGACCPRSLSRLSYECCSVGCGFLGGCYLVPKKVQLDADSVIEIDIFIPPSEPRGMLSIESIDRDIFIPPSEQKDVSSIESIYDSSEKIPVVQMGSFKKVWKKVKDTVKDAIKEKVKEAVKDIIGDTVKETIKDTVKDKFKDTAKDKIKDKIKNTDHPIRKIN
ncbi:hypothetical protein AVEN_107309-1 [Araneus ventricosus]|uniref:Uncharacterized protein n=1 Tax=Araneus ventricosus TaxID=182803 RepID=A0A4Y2DSB7_ARAVE|nr:hypothetical protein AVEN_107309-1 [Araneus ventricosus]